MIDPRSGAQTAVMLVGSFGAAANGDRARQDMQVPWRTPGIWGVRFLLVDPDGTELDRREMRLTIPAARQPAVPQRSF